MEMHYWVGLIGAAVGIILSTASQMVVQYVTSRRDWRNNLTRLKIDAYAEWCDAMEHFYVAYCRQAEGCEKSSTLSQAQVRLMLLERDARARKLIGEVRSSLPEFDSEDHNELAMEAHSCPDWEWKPYRAKMSELMDHLRKRYAV